MFSGDAIAKVINHKIKNKKHVSVKAALHEIDPVEGGLREID